MGSAVRVEEADYASPSRSVRILLVEDDEFSIMAIRRCLRKNDIRAEMKVALNGLEALDILRGSGGEPALEPPYLIVLDLNMPRMNGIEFLREIRKDEMLRKAVVFALTSSTDERDIADAYEQNVAAYLVKDDYENTFDHAVGLIRSYYDMVHFPR